MSALTITIEDESHKLSTDVRDAPDILRMLHEFEITRDSQLTIANAMLREILERKDEYETRLKKATEPLSSALNEIRSWFKPALVPLKEYEEILREKIGSYLLTQKQAREALHALAAQAQAEGDNRTTIMALNAAGAPVIAPVGTSIREVWEAEVEDADLVPREYMIPDLSKISAYARQHKSHETPAPIPGVVFRRKPIVSVRRK